MRILVVAATVQEIPSLHAMRRPDVDVLVTGVGMVATAARCARALATTHYDVALNFGVCGSFDPSLPPGAVVHVTSDRLAELGAEDGDRFLTIHDLQLLGENEFPLQGGALVNHKPPAQSAIASLPAVSAITVNTAHGNEASIARVVDRFHPQVESMEGAAFMYACLVAEIPFAQIRAVSNVVETRNRAGWKLAEAIEQLDLATLQIVNAL